MTRMRFTSYPTLLFCEVIRASIQGKTKTIKSVMTAAVAAAAIMIRSHSGPGMIRHNAAYIRNVPPQRAR